MISKLQDHDEIMRYLTKDRFLTPETLKEADIQVYTDKSGKWIVYPLGS
jgi:glutathionyl-hydroquinone reductase